LRLSWNEIRARAATFAKDWASASYEKGETQSFYNDFFEVFGLQRRRVAIYERQVKKLNNKQGFIDLFWPGVLIVEQKSAGRDLSKAREQAEEYCLGLKSNEHPRYILLSDFQTFELYDLEEGIDCKFDLEDLPQNVEKLGFIIGVQKRSFKDQDPVNIQASELMGRLHDALKDSGYDGHDLEQFLVRILFCLFADDTGIFEPRGIFETLIKDRTAEDGSDLGQWLSSLFDVLNTEESKRYKTLDEDLAAFPYVNGELFSARLPIPAFNTDMRLALIEACEFSWDAISPAIFGALFQSVMDSKERRAKGAHYTTEKNIMKVIGALFLDELRDEFETIKGRKTQRKALLEAFHNKLSKLTFFDPACGCGNFLVIAYRELRQLELEILIETRTGQQLSLDATALSLIDVDQFYGIEIGEFPARIAEVAMWMMDHIMNNRLSLQFGQSYVRIPLKKSPHIKHADALECDWQELLPAKDCSYIFGNPPFLGSKYQTDFQRAQVRRIADLGGSGGTLDYVTAWFLKAGEYINAAPIKIGFVATNSITQGEQVAQFWPLLFERYGLEIIFAHRTFEWGSDARGQAHVHVVILGLCHSSVEPQDKRLFSYPSIKGDPEESRHKALTAYLFDAEKLSNRHLVVKEVSKPINGLEKLVVGSKPIDGSHYIFEGSEKDAFLAKEPKAAQYFHPYIGSREYLNGGDRWILYLGEASPADLRGMPEVRKVVEAVKAERLKSPSKPTQKLAETPTRFHITIVPDSPFLVLPEVSSERREYLPIGWLEPPVVPSNLVKVLLSVDKTIFAILTSAMHMAWLRYIGGRLKSDYRYSIGLVYNNFPMPEISSSQKQRLEKLAQAVIDARNVHHGLSLADLYDPNYMPADLRKAHKAIDTAVDRLYRITSFGSERERVEHLFGLYEKMIDPDA
tara:strand:+ start:13234 stop:15978 length:2745 start_codon:yes stop_codon:yes gene_type:complete